jgi:hypothetical protein
VSSLDRRLYFALGAYGVLAALAAITLEGKMRLAVWIFLAGLALRTIISYKAQE